MTSPSSQEERLLQKKKTDFGKAGHDADLLWPPNNIRYAILKEISQFRPESRIGWNAGK